MKINSAAMQHVSVPKRSRRHYSYDESLDEAAKLIADEPVEIERETPVEEKESGRRNRREQFWLACL